MAFRLGGVNDHKAVVTLVHRFGGGAHARGAIAMLAHVHDVCDLYLGDLPADPFLDARPELTRVGLGFRIGKPLVIDVLVLAGQLAVAATVALGGVKEKVLPMVIPPQRYELWRRGRMPGHTRAQSLGIFLCELEDVYFLHVNQKPEVTSPAAFLEWWGWGQ